MPTLRHVQLRRYQQIVGLLWRHRAARRPDPNHGEEKARRLAQDLERLGPTFIKLGQVLSTRPDLVPPETVKALAHLQDDIAPFDVMMLEAIIEHELKGKMRTLFAGFDEQPLAAASLGQVHRAVLRDGTQVVVKVQRPGIRERIADDLEIFGTVAGALERHTIAGRQYELTMMLEELKQSLTRELDYETEAKNLEWLRDSLQEFPTIVVPRPIRSLTTSRVLTMEFVAGVKVTAIDEARRAHLDGLRLANDVFRAYLKQILVDGMFHADPHPGNVLLTDDNRVGLIDLGMVAFLSPTWRDGLFRLLLSVAEGRSDEVADVCIELADTLEGFDERVFRKSVSLIVANQQNASVKEVEMGTLVLEITKAATNNGIRVPSELTMLGKMLLNLDQVGRSLAPDFMPNEAIREHASNLMQQRMRQQLSPAHLFQKALELNDLVQRAPTRINRFLDALSSDRLRMTLDVIDEKIVVDGMQKVANRISMGIVLAALIIGSAMLMRIDTDFRILGYPGFAILFFIGAALGAVALMFNILFKDERVARQRKREQKLKHTPK